MVGDWEIDRFLLAVVLITAAYLFPKGLWIVICETIAIGFCFLYGKYKQGAIRGKGKQLMYLIGLKQPKTLIPNNIRYFVGG
jgi:conjugal transfer pilus assembly protein TraL